MAEAAENDCGIDRVSRPKGAMEMRMQDNTTEYRRFATECLELARQMSATADRDRLTNMASRWSALAAPAEASAVREEKP